MSLNFNSQGVIPRGDYELSIQDLRASILVKGPKSLPPGWDAEHRLKLVNNLEVLANQLWSVGIKEIYVDGSFVEMKERPSDIDGYFVCDLMDYVRGDLQRRLNSIDPYECWEWDTKSRHPGRNLPMQLRYQVELYPYSIGTMFGTDSRGRPLEMCEAFRLTKYGRVPKGIVRLKPTGGVI